MSYIVTKAVDNTGYYIMLKDMTRTFARYNEEYEDLSFCPQVHIKDAEDEKDALFKLKQLLKKRDIMLIKEDLP